jgi:hypothetical protein
MKWLLSNSLYIKELDNKLLLGEYQNLAKPDFLRQHL